MKTVSKKYYICEICGKSSQVEERIAECQQSHLFINDSCEIEHRFEKGKKSPKFLTVTFPDGSVVGYSRDWEELAPKPAPPEEVEQDG